VLVKYADITISQQNYFYIFTFRSTNTDGRGGFLTQSSFKQAVYKLHFDTGAYFKKNSTKGFYPYVEVRLFKKNMCLF
jgi:5-hydroxyisourate hydrolase-like protein (transthyretin family)